MPNPDLDPTTQEIRQPVLREPDALVENIYPLPGTEEMPDLESQDVMGEYLIDRFLPEDGPQTRVVLTPSGRTLPGIQRVPNGYKEVTRRRPTDEWRVTPRQALAVTLGSMALFNLAGNPSTVAGAAEYAWHAVYRTFDPVHDKVITEHTRVVTPGPTTRIDVTAGTADQVGSTAVDSTVIKLFVDQIQQARQRGGKVAEIDITGNTSDEWAGDSSIGVADSGNQQLGLARAEAALKELRAEGLQVGPDELRLGQQEHILTPVQTAEALAAAKADGFTSVKAAIEAVDSGRSVSPSLAQKIKQFFTGKADRGVSLSAKVEYPGKAKISTKTTKVTVPGVDHAPHVPKPHWRWFIPLVPFRRRERYDDVKQLHRWQYTPSQPILRPKIIRQDKEQVWLRLRPEAVKEDGTLVDNPWAYTRKYEHLLRDNRIVDMLRADYQDAKGDDKSLRIMFVDQAPDQLTVDVFSNLLTKFAAMEDGKIGNRISAIFVYPRENTGTDHRDPKRIAMGIDRQSDENILGTRTYALGLVELHMPTSWDPEQLELFFKEVNGPAWAMAHEVAGHGTDESDAQLRLRRVLARGIAQAHVIEGEPRALKMSRLDKTLHKLPRRSWQKRKPVEFDIVYPVLDNNGQIVTMSARVKEDDDRLTHASQATIVGHRPTRYAGANASEHYAETGAAVTTGIDVPYGEAHVNVDRLRTDSGKRAVFANGYRPDTRGQQLFTKSVGAQTGSFPVSFANPPEVTISRLDPNEDPLIRQELARSSHLRSAYPGQLIAILARVARSSRR